VQQSDGVGEAPAVGPPPARPEPAAAPLAGPPPDPELLAPLVTRRPRRRGQLLLGLFLAAVLGVAAALGLSRLLLHDSPSAQQHPPPSGAPSDGPSATGSASANASPSTSPSDDLVAQRADAVEALLAARAAAVTARDRDAFLATVDPEAQAFQSEQGTLFDRLAAVDLDSWSYTVDGDGPGFAAGRAAELPTGSAIVRVRLSYRLAGTETTTDREQYLTVVPRGGRWLLAADTDAAAAGLETERDLWDLGPVTAVHGDSSLVLADERGWTRRQIRRIAEEADLAVHDVDDVWTGEWSRRPVVLLPRSQDDMATLIGSDGQGLAQIAAVTTGSFEDGLSRGDRIVVNPAAWRILGALGRRVVLTHEMTHVATRSTSVVAPPIWLSEGFADYVAYQASPVPTAVVAGDVLDDVRDGNGPTHLPEADDFDASRGDIAAAYEGSWLAARMIAEDYGRKRLVRLYAALTDSAGEGWPDELRDVLGIGQRELVRDWKAYLADKAAA
jgi:hypothetical protein